MNRRKIYHELMKPDDAIKRIENFIRLKPLGMETVKVEDATGRVLAEDVRALSDAPPFDRSLVDGFAVRAEDTYEAEEDMPVELRLKGKIEPGERPSLEVLKGECIEVATGAPIPPLADSVVMVEYTSIKDDKVYVYRKIRPGENIGHAGSDLLKGEVIAWRGSILTPMLIGALASVGVRYVKVYRQPIAAIISTGNELQSPGEDLSPWKIYDANAYMLASALREIGVKPLLMGVIRDEFEEIKQAVDDALDSADVVLISGGTSAGTGDLVYKVLESYEPGVLVHGLKVKPGKPTVIALADEKLIFGLPGFPVSCLMIFNLVVKPILAKLAGLPEYLLKASKVRARLSLRVYGATGRLTLVPVLLVRRKGFIAYPLGGNSGSIYRLSLSDGYISIPDNVDYVDSGSEVEVTLFRTLNSLPDLTILGSHCPALETILEKLRAKYIVRSVNVGSTGGLKAVKEGIADMAGIHLYDPLQDSYNTPFVKDSENVVLVRGYSRLQGLIVARGNPLNIRSFEDILLKKPRFINRNRGSGTRNLIDYLLFKACERLGLKPSEIQKIPGYNVEAKTHTGVALAILQDRADVGVGVKYIADLYGLDFIPLREEEYDFIIRKEALNEAPVKTFLEILRSEEFKRKLEKMPGFKPPPNMGSILIET